MNSPALPEPPSTIPSTWNDPLFAKLVIAAGAFPGRTVAPLATTTRVFEVVTRTPSVSLSLQVVVALAIVGSGEHCANAGPATRNVATKALVCNAHMRTRRVRDVISPTFMHSPGIIRKCYILIRHVSMSVRWRQVRMGLFLIHYDLQILPVAHDFTRSVLLPRKGLKGLRRFFAASPYRLWERFRFSNSDALRFWGVNVSTINGASATAPISVADLRDDVAADLSADHAVATCRRCADGGDAARVCQLRGH